MDPKSIQPRPGLLRRAKAFITRKFKRPQSAKSNKPAHERNRFTEMQEAMEEARNDYAKYNYQQPTDGGGQTIKNKKYRRGVMGKNRKVKTHRKKHFRK